MADEVKRLIEGHRDFREHYFEGDNSLYRSLVENGQNPKFIVIACSDSRVDPSIILNCKPGDLFVIRNVANLIPPSEIDRHYHGTSAALEFGVCGLNIKHVIVLGHSQCGGVHHLLKTYRMKADVNENSFLSKWMELAEPACKQTLANHPTASLEEHADLCAKISLIRSLENLKTFSWVQARLGKNEINLHAWYFDLSTGNISSFNPETGKFGVLN